MFFFLFTPPMKTTIPQRTIIRSLVQCGLLPMLMILTSVAPLSRLSGTALQGCWITCKSLSGRSTWTKTTSSPSCGKCKQEVRWQVSHRYGLTISRYPHIFHPTSKCGDYPHEAGEMYAVRGIRCVPKRRCCRGTARTSDMFVSWVGRRDTQRDVSRWGVSVQTRQFSLSP